MDRGVIADSGVIAIDISIHIDRLISNRINIASNNYPMDILTEAMSTIVFRESILALVSS